MKDFLSEYSGVLIAALLGGIVITLLFKGSFFGSEGNETTGIMGAVGNEAIIKEDDLTDNREDHDLAGINNASSIKVTCTGVVRAETPTDINTLFLAKDGEKDITVSVVHIYDNSGKDILNTDKASVTGNQVTVKNAGRYKFSVKAYSKTSCIKNFDVMVEDDSVEEGEI